MDLAKERRCLAVSFLLPLLLLIHSTDACYCIGRPIPLQKAYCSSDMVVRGSFVDARFESEDMTWATYEFKVNKVYKSLGHRMREKENFYTQILGTTCGYRHSDPFNGDEYLVTGKHINGQLIISACSFIQPWDTVTEQERESLEICKIAYENPDYFLEVEVPDQLLWICHACA